MKYLPLIWSAVMRKPARTILTLLSVTVAFTLFGLMIGLNATFDEVAAKARADRIFTNARFGGNGMPIAVARQIAAIPGVKVVTAVNVILGYVQDPKNQAVVVMVDDNVPKVFGDWGVTEELWDRFGYGEPCSLIRTQWPEPVAVPGAAAAREELDWVVRLISEVRSVRTEMSVPPGTLTPILLRDAAPGTLARGQGWLDAIRRLARASELTALSGEVPKGAAQVMLNEATVVLPL